MNIALVLTHLIWFTSNQAGQLTGVTVLLLSLSSFKIVREYKRTAFSLLAMVLAVATATYLARSAGARSASVAWYLLYFGLAPTFLLATVGGNRSPKNFVLAAISIASLIAVSFGFSAVIEIVGLALAALAIYSIDLVDIPKRDNGVRASRELIGFPLVLQTTSLGPKDWYEVKSLKR